MAQPQQDVFHALDQALATAVAAASPSVVHVARGHGHAGTGIVWSDDLVISASFHTPDRTHVGIPTPASPDAVNGSNETQLPVLDRRPAEVIGRDPGTDIALLRVVGGGLTPAKFRELGSLAVGNVVLALGRPGRTVRASLRAIGVLGPEVRTPHGGTLDRYIESDRQIPRGFAGGPLVDVDGAVVGMNTRTLLRGEDIAVPTATLRRVVDELRAHGGVRRGYLGVGAFPAHLPQALAQLAKLDRGALIASIEDGSPAATAGLIVGDIIISLESSPSDSSTPPSAARPRSGLSLGGSLESGGASIAITGPDSLRLALGDRPGATVELTVLRGGAVHTFSAVLGSRP